MSITKEQIEAAIDSLVELDHASERVSFDDLRAILTALLVKPAPPIADGGGWRYFKLKKSYAELWRHRAGRIDEAFVKGVWTPCDPIADWNDERWRIMLANGDAIEITDPSEIEKLTSPASPQAEKPKASQPQNTQEPSSSNCCHDIHGGYGTRASCPLCKRAAEAGDVAETPAPQAVCGHVCDRPDNFSNLKCTLHKHSSETLHESAYHSVGQFGGRHQWTDADGHYPPAPPSVEPGVWCQKSKRTGESTEVRCEFVAGHAGECSFDDSRRHVTPAVAQPDAREVEIAELKQRNANQTEWLTAARDAAGLTVGVNGLAEAFASMKRDLDMERAINGNLQHTINTVGESNKALRTRLAATEAVVEAAKAYVNRWSNLEDTKLRQALANLKETK